MVHLAEDRWSSAIGTFLDALKLLEVVNDKLYTNHVYLSLGLAYQDFAEKSGGLGEREGNFTGGRARSLWDTIEQLPFNSYAVLAKRIDWLPTWNLGTNYQNWIIYYLLRQGRYWYRRAEKLATNRADHNSRFDAQRMIARLDLALGRTSRAIKQYKLLSSLPQVRASRYRTAQTELDLGIAHLDVKELEPAVRMISRGVTTLRDFNDYRSVGYGMRCLGDIYAHTNRLPEAISAYESSIDAFALTTEVLEYTTSVIALEKLDAKIADDSDLKDRIIGITKSVRQRAYISRFPDRLLRLFRRISLLVALPISFFSAFVLTLSLVGVLFSLEGGIRLLLIGEPFDLAILRSVVMLIMVIIGFLGIVWFYQLIYTVIGAAVVAHRGKNLIIIEREQPIYYFVDANQLQLHSGHMNAKDHTLTIPWDAIVQLSSLVYYRWLSPIALYSTTRITLKDFSSVDIPALTNHYTDLIRVIESNLGSAIKVDKFSFSVFRSWFSVIFVITALFLSVARVFTRQLFDMPGYRFARAVAEGGKHVPLWITSVTLFFAVSLLLLFQTGLLWRLLLHQNIIHRQTGYRSQALPAGIILFLALVSTLITALWGVFLYSLTAGAS